MECTRLERESKQKDQNGSWETVNLKGFENIKKNSKDILHLQSKQAGQDEEGVKIPMTRQRPVLNDFTKTHFFFYICETQD